MMLRKVNFFLNNMTVGEYGGKRTLTNGWLFVSSWFVEYTLNFRQQRMLTVTTTISEIVQVQCPHHTTAKAERSNQLRFLVDHCFVIEGHPLVALVCVWSHAALLILHHLPALVLHAIANLIERTRYGCECLIARRPNIFNDDFILTS